MAGIQIPIGGDMAPFVAVMADLKGMLGKMRSEVKNTSQGMSADTQSAFAGIGASVKASMAGIAATIAGLGIGAVAGIGAGMAKSIGAASEMEGLKTAFIPLLGSADAAQTRIEELSKFAAETPFELPEVARASKVLETLTHGSLSTSEGLRMVGDAASASGQPFDELATWIGRLYDGLQSGRPVGEAMARLQELGLVSGDVRGKIEEMQKEGANGAAVWQVAAAALGRFSGSMELQSETWNGKLSTLKDNINQTFAAFGKPVMDALKPYLASVAEMTGKLVGKAAEFGSKVAGVIQLVAAAFSQGELGNLVGAGLKIGFTEAVNLLWRHLNGVVGYVGEAIMVNIRNSIAMLQILGTAGFWQGMKHALIGVVYDLFALIQLGIANQLEAIKPIAELFGKGDSVGNAANTVRESAAGTHELAVEQYKQAGKDLGPALEKMEIQAVEGLKSIYQKYINTFKNTKDIIDTSGMREEMNDLVKKIFASVGKVAEETGVKPPAAAVSSENQTDKTGGTNGDISNTNQEPAGGVSPRGGSISTSLGRVGGGGNSLSFFGSAKGALKSVGDWVGGGGNGTDLSAVTGAIGVSNRILGDARDILKRMDAKLGKTGGSEAIV